jgi:lambda repressor-like predicted transcriptional regulator
MVMGMRWETSNRLLARVYKVEPFRYWARRYPTVSCDISNEIFNSHRSIKLDKADYGIF